MSRNALKKKWTAEEIEVVKRGHVPEGRTYLQAASYAYVHGIPWNELRKETCEWWWRPEEEALLRAGKIPPKRSWNAIRLHKKKLGLTVHDHPVREDFIMERGGYV